MMIEKLNRRWGKEKFVCIGLDADPSRLPRHLAKYYLPAYPDEAVFQLNRDIIDNTSDLVCAYKLNSAFYETSPLLTDAMRRTVEYIKKTYRDIPVLGDLKRGDTENTGKYYAASGFERFGFDALTVNPYPGMDTLNPYLEYPDKGVFVVCRTSNPGSGDFQDLPIPLTTVQKIEEKNGNPLSFEQVQAAREAAGVYQKYMQEQYGFDINDGNKNDLMIASHQLVALKTAFLAQKHPNTGLVAGSTFPQFLEGIRILAPKLPILIPGIGDQKGDLGNSLRHALTKDGYGVLISASRSLIYASGGKNFAQAARREALKLQREITTIRDSLRKTNLR